MDITYIFQALENNKLHINNTFIYSLNKLRTLYTRIKEIYDDPADMKEFTRTVEDLVTHKKSFDDNFLYGHIFKQFIDIVFFLVYGDTSVHRKKIIATYIDASLIKIVCQYDFYFHGVILFEGPIPTQDFTIRNAPQGSYQGQIIYIPEKDLFVGTTATTGTGIWDMNTQGVNTYHIPRIHSLSIRYLAFVPPNRLVTSDSRIHQLWDVNTGQLIATLEGDNVLRSLIVSGSKIIGGFQNNHIYIWNSDGQLQTDLYNESSLIDYMVNVRDKLIAGSDYGDTKIWNLNTLSVEFAIKDRLSFIIPIDDTRAIVVVRSVFLSILNMDNGTMTSIYMNYRGFTKVIKFDATHVVVQFMEGSIHIINILSKQIHQIIDALEERLTGVFNNHIITCRANTLKMWDLKKVIKEITFSYNITFLSVLSNNRIAVIDDMKNIIIVG